MIIVIYGPEGSGKTTQAKKLTKKTNLSYISTGDMVRCFAQNDKGHLGGLCQHILKNGIYLEDKFIFNILIKHLKKENLLEKGFIIEGFPRTYKQAVMIDKFLKKEKKQISQFFYLKINRSLAIKRSTVRKRDKYDLLKKVESKLNEYYKEEKEILNYYKGKNLLKVINGNKSKISIFNEIINKCLPESKIKKK